MIGALLRIFDGDMSVAEEIIRQNVPSKPKANAHAAFTAFEQLEDTGISTSYLQESLNSGMDDDDAEPYNGNHVSKAEPQGLSAPYWSVPMTENKTGNWRLLTPVYADRTPPCNSSCPAGTDVRGFVKKVGEQKFEEAFKILYRHNPFPGICGRVCPHFCEQNCNRNDLDDGLNIGAIERFLGDKFTPGPVLEAPKSFSEKIAVVGAGPAGLTAALRLREKGYPVTVFEALPKAGGMMRTGIPRFRLPDEVLDREINRITKRGVRIEYNCKMTLTELENKFDAVITAVGSHVGSGLGMDNEHLVKEGIRFLHQFKLNGDDAGIRKGDTVAIIGGGNTAIDVSRTVLRLGAVPVIYYRRTIREMPAIAPEVEEALAEGVVIEFLTAPLSITKLENNSLELNLTKMELGAPDESGRRSPKPVSGSEHSIIVNHLVTAIGQRYDDFIFGKQKVKPVQGRIGFSGDMPVFCAGDMAWGGTVTEAIGSGNKVAAEVHAWLRHLNYDPTTDVPEVVLPNDINFTYYLPSARQQGIQRHPTDFFQNFTEVTKGFTKEDAVTESARCLHCGDCFMCGNCLNYCPDSAISVDEQGRLRIDYEYCKGCGICMHECPCSAIQFDLTKEELLL